MALVPKVEKIARNFRQLRRVALGTILERNLVILNHTHLQCTILFLHVLR